MNCKINCWEYRNCGLEPGGIFAEIHGTCPVPEAMRYDGVNGGRGAGRACWTVMNSGSGNEPFVCRNRRQSCFHCEFYLRVHSEEEYRNTVDPVEEIARNSKFVLG